MNISITASRKYDNGSQVIAISAPNAAVASGSTASSLVDLLFGAAQDAIKKTNVTGKVVDQNFYKRGVSITGVTDGVVPTKADIDITGVLQDDNFPRYSFTVTDVSIDGSLIQFGNNFATAYLNKLKDIISSSATITAVKITSAAFNFR